MECVNPSAFIFWKSARVDVDLAQENRGYDPGLGGGGGGGGGGGAVPVVLAAIQAGLLSSGWEADVKLIVTQNSCDDPIARPPTVPSLLGYATRGPPSVRT